MMPKWRTCSEELRSSSYRLIIRRDIYDNTGDGQLRYGLLSSAVA